MSKNETIVDRVVERIKKQPIGDLITDEDLHEIVKQAIPKAFFDYEVVYDGYGRITEKRDPYLVSALRGALKEAADKAIGEWVDKNEKFLFDRMRDISEQGLESFAETAMNQKVFTMMRPFFDAFVRRENERRRRAGLYELSLDQYLEGRA